MTSDRAALGLRRWAALGPEEALGSGHTQQGWQVALLEPSQDSADPQALGRTSTPLPRKESEAQRNEPLPPQAGRRQTLTGPCWVV